MGQGTADHCFLVRGLGFILEFCDGTALQVCSVLNTQLSQTGAPIEGFA